MIVIPIIKPTGVLNTAHLALPSFISSPTGSRQRLQGRPTRGRVGAGQHGGKLLAGLHPGEMLAQDE